MPVRSAPRSVLRPRPSQAALLIAGATLLLSACGTTLPATGEMAARMKAALNPSAAAGATAELALLETSDLHANVLSYDYFKLAANPSYGFERTATLIRAAREQYPNNLLLDNGDTIQGNPLADNEATVNPLSCGEMPSIFKVMKAMRYDAGTLGNHEFNYGLPFLDQILGNRLDTAGLDRKCGVVAQRPGHEIVLANVHSSKTGQPLIAPYTILRRTLSATLNGQTVQLPIRVGVIGLTTTGILNWDKRFLDGKVTARGAVETAREWVPKMRAEGADVVVAMLHGGIDAGDYTEQLENPALHLAKVPGIDAIFMGHQHLQFPKADKPDFAQPGADNTKGTLNGVPAAMPLAWGKGLGVIAMKLTWDGTKWSIRQDDTRVEVRTTVTGKDAAGKPTYVAADPSIAPLVQARHEDTIRYVKSPVGATDFRMSTRLADVGDPSAVQLVNMAQQAYVADYIRDNLPQYARLPVLSVSAPFKSGTQGPDDYTDVPAGALAINNAGDLYLYPNTIYAVKVNGAQLKAWLEASAKRFNRIDPKLTSDQWLVNASFPGYNFDFFTSPDVRYEIDVTRPEGQRIRNLRFKGRAMSAKAEFIIATNNYRATTKMIPELDGRATVWAAPDTNREVLIQYVKAAGQLTRAQHGSTRSWRFAPSPTRGRVLFKSSPGADELAGAAGLRGIQATQEALDAKGLATFAITLKDSR